MKNVLYFGHLGKIDKQKSYGDAIGYWTFLDYIKEHHADILIMGDHSKDINVIYEDVKAGGMIKVRKNINFYLLGCGTCLSNLCRPYADQILINLSKSNVPYGVLGAGVYYENNRPQVGKNYITSPENDKMTLDYINKAEIILVRDKKSKEYMDNLSGKNLDNVIVCNDPGAIVSYPKIKDKSLQKGTKPILGFNLAGSSGSSLGSILVTADHHKKILDFLLTQREKYDLLFVPFNKKDVKIGKRLEDQYHIRSIPFRSPQYIDGMIQYCHIFLGIRVHADITCSAYSIPFLSIAYTNPNVNFLNNIDYKHFIYLPELNNTSIQDRFTELENDYDNVKKLLSEKTEESKKQYYKCVEMLCQKIKES